MKKPFYLFIVGILVCQICISAQDNSKKDLYARKAANYSKMKSGGIALTIGGIILTAVGIAVLSDAANMPYNTIDEQNAADTKIILGAYAATGGLIATGGGITLWIIGGNKNRYYLKKFNEVSFNLNPNLNQKFSLVYKF